VNLPAHFHPILVDRVVNFIYTSDYDFDPASKGIIELKSENFNFHNATFIPTDNPPSPAVTALVGIQNYMFHLHMYALAEELNYDALKAVAHSKLVEMLVTRRGRLPCALKDVVDATFAPPGTAARVCKDDDAALQNFAVAAVLAHEAKDWEDKDCNAFTESLQAPEYAPFWSAHQAIKEENQDLIKADELVKQARKEAIERRRRAAEERRLGQIAKAGAVQGSSSSNTGGISKKKDRIQRRKLAKEANKAERAYGYGDVDMQVD
jgi:hypothetical protein